MTDPVNARNHLPPDPFASDNTVHVAPVTSASRALLPPDPFEPRSTPHIDYASLGKTMASFSTIPAKLDAARDAYSGPYQIVGQTVWAAPQFRMNGAANQRVIFSVETPSQHDPASFQKCLTARGKEVYGILVKAGVGNPAGVMLGYGSPASLVKATQALYFAGKLPCLPAPATLADAVRQMQWDNGIGVDCVDYTMQALAEVKGKSVTGLGLTPGIDPFAPHGSHCPPQFTRTSALSAKPGDIMALDEPGSVGHRVIVRDHTLASAETKRALTQAWGSTAGAFFESSGPFHVYAVDSSWGAGNGQPYGGYRKDTWVFDAGSKVWLSFSHHENRTLVSIDGPAGESLAGTYRYGGA
jgi:hypothetical protein